MSKPVLYLAGPIWGCTEAQAKDWRAEVSEALPFMNCISPLRCEPLVGERYDISYTDPCFGMPKSIIAKNFLDVQRCDMVLAFFPTPPEIAEAARALDMLEEYSDFTDVANHLDALRRVLTRSPQRSIGTIGEISWAYAMRKPLVVVSADPVVLHHPFTAEQPSWPVLPDLKEAVRLISGIFTDYVRG